jgi:co-chaperonin GroES (HSP10)
MIEEKETELPKPLHNYVVLRSEKDLKSASGLFVGNVAEYGIVVAVGPGQWENGSFVPTSVKVGDRVLLDAPPGSVGSFRWGEKYQAVRECFIAAVLPGETPPEAPRIDVPQLVI